MADLIKQRNDIDSPWARTHMNLLVMGGLALICLAGCVSFKKKVAGTLPVSDSNIMGSLVRASKEIKLEGAVHLNRTNLRLETREGNITVQVPRGTSLNAKLVAVIDGSGNLQIQPGTSFTFSREVGVEAGKSPKVKVRSISMAEGENKLTASVRLNLILALASWLQRGLVGSGPVDPLEMKTVVRRLDFQAISLDLRPGATIKLPNGSRVTVGEHSSFGGRDVRWSYPDELDGEFVLNLDLAQQSELRVQGNMIDMEGRLEAAGRYTRSQGKETLHLGEQVGKMSVLVGPVSPAVLTNWVARKMARIQSSVSIRRASITKTDKKGVVRLKDFAASNVEMTWERGFGNNSLTLLANGSTGGSLEDIPIPNGTFNCASVVIPKFSLAMKTGNTAEEQFEMKVDKASLKSWTVAISTDVASVDLAGEDVGVDTLVVKKLENLNFSIPTGALRLKSAAFKNDKVSASFGFDAKSRLDCSITNLSVTLFPNNGATMELGTLRVSGEMNAATFAAGGKTARFDHIAVRDTVLVFGGEPHFTGQLQFVCNSGNIRQALLQALGKPESYDIKMLHIKSIDPSIGQVGGTVSFDISGVNNGSVNIAMTTGQSSIDVRGESEEPAEDKHSLVLGIAVPTISAAYQLSNGSAQVTSKIDVQSSRKICLYTDSPAEDMRPKPRYWINLDPFTVHGDGTFQVFQNARGRIVIKMIDLHSVGKDRIHIDIDSKNLGGFGASVDIQPWDSERIQAKASLGPIPLTKVNGPNFIREALRAVIGKEFEISQ